MGANEFVFGVGPAEEIQKALRRHQRNLKDQEMNILKWLSAGDNIVKLGEVVQGLAEISQFEPVNNPMIVVNRTVQISYPEGVRSLLHPELEKTGPTEYNVKTIGFWREEHQAKGGGCSGTIILDQLSRRLSDCLGWYDLNAIKRRGPAFFRENFYDNAVYGWRSAVRSHDGRIHVPFLVDDMSNLLLSWRAIENGFSFEDPALLFGK